MYTGRQIEPLKWGVRYKCGMCICIGQTSLQWQNTALDQVPGDQGTGQDHTLIIIMIIIIIIEKT
jgi:hypothetical protein